MSVSVCVRVSIFPGGGGEVGSDTTSRPWYLMCGQIFLLVQRVPDTLVVLFSFVIYQARDCKSYESQTVVKLTRWCIILHLLVGLPLS